MWDFIDIPFFKKHLGIYVYVLGHADLHNKSEIKKNAVLYREC
jgi:hypothetical protein